jgi:DNA-binding CsgD family transcriptional regulator
MARATAPDRGGRGRRESALATAAQQQNKPPGSSEELPGALSLIDSGLFILTGREVQALACMARGLSYAEAGQKLGLAACSVARHVALARLALGARSTAHAVALAMAAGVIDVGGAAELLGGSTGCSRGRPAGGAERG